MLKPRFIERFRRLPYPGQVLVHPGDWVDEQTTVAQIDYIPGAMRRVDAARPLRVGGAELHKHLLLGVGDQLVKGQVLAANSSFGQRLSVASPCDGYVGLVSRSLGYVYIRQPIPVGFRAMVTINVMQELNLQPYLFNDCLRVQVGSTVIPDQVIAERKIRWNRYFVQSPVYGKVVNINDGCVTIQPLHVRTELSAYLAGRVTSVVDGQGVNIQSFAQVMPGRYGIGGEAGGALLSVAQPDRDITTADVSADWQGKVVVGGKSVGLEVLRLAGDVGTKALVLAHIPLEILSAYSGSEMVGFTGDEGVPMTIVLTEGFLPAPMPRMVWQRLAEMNGNYASVNGTTHIRAGVIRPEVVVSQRVWPESAHEDVEQPPALTIGKRVRMVTNPYRGLVGTVVALPPDRQPIATGSLAKVAIVDLSGEQVAVPMGNLEVWQGA